MERIKIILWVIAVTLCLGAHPAAASTPASIDVVGPVGVPTIDDLIPVDIQITSGGLVVNAAEITLRFSPRDLQVDHIQREQTVFTLWPETPRWDNTTGTAHVLGGRPGGVVMVNATVATVYFRALHSGSAQISVDGSTSTLRLNDGVGSAVTATPGSITIAATDPLSQALVVHSDTHPDANHWYAKPDIRVSWTTTPGTEYRYMLTADPHAAFLDQPGTTDSSASFTHTADGQYYFILQQRLTGQNWSDTTQRRILIDTTPPAPFHIIHPNPKTIGQAEIISWSTTDGLSGIDHAVLFVNGRETATVSSPVRLQDAWRGKVLMIHVIDQAGNMQSTQWLYATDDDASTMIGLIVIGLGVIVLVVGATVLFLRRRK